MRCPGVGLSLSLARSRASISQQQEAFSLDCGTKFPHRWEGLRLGDLPFSSEPYISTPFPPARLAADAVFALPISASRAALFSDDIARLRSANLCRLFSKAGELLVEDAADDIRVSTYCSA